MDWHLKVSKIVHFSWGNTKLPYLRLITVRSFIRHNPDWKIMLWNTLEKGELVTWEKGGALDYELNCEDYHGELMNLPVEKQVFDMEKYGFSNSISEVHKSDYLRLFVLWKYGGVWADMDILFFNPMTSLAVNIPQNNHKTTFLCPSYFGYSNAFMMGVVGGEIFHELFRLAKKNFDPAKHQCMGLDLFKKWKEELNLRGPAVADIGMNSVYAHDVYNIGDLFDGSKPKFTKNSIGCHWYAGHESSGKFLFDTYGGTRNIPNNILGNLIKDYESFTD